MKNFNYYNRTNMMKEKIINEIKKNINDVEIKLHSNDNKYFNAIIISDFFEKKDLLERQKLIYNIIGEYIKNKEIHAISFKTYTKNEWNKDN